MLALRAGRRAPRPAQVMMNMPGLPASATGPGSAPESLPEPSAVGPGCPARECPESHAATACVSSFA
eukprot:2520252-Alexandrium_andersonii.AAC.1